MQSVGRNIRYSANCHKPNRCQSRNSRRSFALKIPKGSNTSEVLLVAGASTLPGLSSAVINSVREQFSKISDIEISIAPAHQTPRGESTVAAVLSYCGKPFKVLQNGQWRTRYGWQDIKVQKYPSLGTRLSGACEVPDLTLLPKQFPEVKTVIFHAALEAKWEQLGLWVMAWLTRAKIIPEWSKYTVPFSSLSKRLIGLGSDRGGMHIRITGVDQSQSRKVLAWYLTAENNHGPEIPCSPALVLIRKLINDETELHGAYPCLGLVTLKEFKEEVSKLEISWVVEEQQ